MEFKLEPVNSYVKQTKAKIAVSVAPLSDLLIYSYHLYYEVAIVYFHLIDSELESKTEELLKYYDRVLVRRAKEYCSKSCIYRLILFSKTKGKPDP